MAKVLETPASPGTQIITELGLNKGLPPAALMNVDEVAALLGLGRSSVWRHVRRGTIPAPVRVGGSTRWRRADLEAFISSLAA